MAALWIQSPHPVRIYRPLHKWDDYERKIKCGDTMINCPSATMIQEDCEAWLLPTQEWDHKFSDGWNKLPAELKVQILGHNLTFPKPIMADWRRREFTDRLKALYHHLHMTPEIASLARNIFYETNTFVISAEEHPSPEAQLLYNSPKAFATATIPRIRTSLNPIARTNTHHINFRLLIYSSHWAVLKRLSVGEFGFNNLRRVRVDVVWSCADRWSTKKEHPGYMHWKDYISKHLEGVVEFTCTGSVGLWAGASGFLDISVAEFEDFLKSKVTFTS
ncbi:hypothetical protein CC80DRAFT_546403 [Byssothecium circinans]|uniref:Uncharacterized protein n=1 Tax=Byssothecium circinans TaxID=147558 RepID=A0A6A5UAM5_9PLEO|nr:hypothetical protein CC80DRAFT_546403 [Byssothecium circinans]